MRMTRPLGLAVKTTRFVLLGGAMCVASACASDSTSSQEPDDELASVEQLTDGSWRPIRVDDVWVDPNEGDYWNFAAQDGGFVLDGFDGCNRFGTSTQPGEDPPSIEMGRVLNLALVETAMGCIDVQYGPHPNDGETLTLSAHGTRLEVGHGTQTRIVLVRVQDADLPLLDRVGR